MNGEELSCTLRGAELFERLEEWKQVTSRAESRVLEDNTLVAVYPREPELLEELRRLIAAEKDCCSFLAFHIDERDTRAVVRMEVPEGMQDVLALMMGLATQSTG